MSKITKERLDNIIELKEIRDSYIYIISQLPLKFKITHQINSSFPFPKIAESHLDHMETMFDKISAEISVLQFNLFNQYIKQIEKALDELDYEYGDSYDAMEMMTLRIIKEGEHITEDSESVILYDTISLPKLKHTTTFNEQSISLPISGTTIDSRCVDWKMSNTPFTSFTNIDHGP